MHRCKICSESYLDSESLVDHQLANHTPEALEAFNISRQSSECNMVKDWQSRSNENRSSILKKLGYTPQDIQTLIGLEYNQLGNKLKREVGESLAKTKEIVQAGEAVTSDENKTYQNMYDSYLQARSAQIKRPFQDGNESKATEEDHDGTVWSDFYGKWIDEDVAKKDRRARGFQSEVNEYTKDDVFDYLFDLQESGDTNMMGASPYVQREFPFLNKNEVDEIVVEWMSNWDSIAKRMGKESKASEKYGELTSQQKNVLNNWVNGVKKEEQSSFPHTVLIGLSWEASDLPYDIFRQLTDIQDSEYLYSAITGYVHDLIFADESRASEDYDLGTLDVDEGILTSSMWEQSDGSWLVKSEGGQYDEYYQRSFSDSVDAQYYMDKVNSGELTKTDLERDEMLSNTFSESKANETPFSKDMDGTYGSRQGWSCPWCNFQEQKLEDHGRILGHLTNQHGMSSEDAHRMIWYERDQQETFFKDHDSTYQRLNSGESKANEFGQTWSDELDDWVRYEFDPTDKYDLEYLKKEGRASGITDSDNAWQDFWDDWGVQDGMSIHTHLDGEPDVLPDGKVGEAKASEVKCEVCGKELPSLRDKNEHEIDVHGKLDYFAGMGSLGSLDGESKANESVTYVYRIDKGNSNVDINELAIQYSGTVDGDEISIPNPSSYNFSQHLEQLNIEYTIIAVRDVPTTEDGTIIDGTHPQYDKDDWGSYESKANEWESGNKNVHANFRVQIKNRKTGEIASDMKATSLREAETIMSGASINMNHDDWEIVIEQGESKSREGFDQGLFGYVDAKCKTCGIEFNSIPDMDDHYKNNPDHTSNISDIHEPIPNSESLLGEALKSHTDYHNLINSTLSGEHSIPCSKCSKKFKAQESLDIHYNDYHTDLELKSLIGELNSNEAVGLTRDWDDDEKRGVSGEQPAPIEDEGNSSDLEYARKQMQKDKADGEPAEWQVGGEGEQDTEDEYDPINNLIKGVKADDDVEPSKTTGEPWQKGGENQDDEDYQTRLNQEDNQTLKTWIDKDDQDPFEKNKDDESLSEENEIDNIFDSEQEEELKDALDKWVASDDSDKEIVFDPFAKNKDDESLTKEEDLTEEEELQKARESLKPLSDKLDERSNLTKAFESGASIEDIYSKVGDKEEDRGGESDLNDIYNNVDVKLKTEKY